MSKILFLGTALFLYSITFAAANAELPNLKADKVFIPIGKTGQKISYAELATISLKDLQALTGKKMNSLQRINFRIAQSKIRKSIAPDGTIRNKKIQKMFLGQETGQRAFILEVLHWVFSLGSSGF